MRASINQEEAKESKRKTDGMDGGEYEMSIEILVTTIGLMVLIGLFANEEYKWQKSMKDVWCEYSKALCQEMKRHDNARRGSSFDAFLEEHGILDEVTASALRRVADIIDDGATDE